MKEKQSHLCCATCKWSGKIDFPLIPKRLEEEPLATCALHDFIVWSPDLHFCSQFSSQTDTAQKTVKDLPSEISDGLVYVWMQVSYRDLAAEETMYSIQKILPAATLDEYAQMTPTQKSLRYSRIYNRVFFDIQQQLAPAQIMEEEIYQKKHLPIKLMRRSSGRQ
jgi:hypothetical protein